MNSTISYIFGQVQATQTPNRIVVGGIRTYPLLKAIQKTFDTSRVSVGMFYVTTGTRLEIPIFFAYDFLEVIKQLAIKGSGHINLKVLKSVEDELMKLPIFQRTITAVRSKLNKKQLEQFNVFPLGNQEEFFKAYDSSTQRYGLKGYILASPPGTGKTLSSLFLGSMLQRKVSIIFSPSNALERVWEDTFNKFFRVPPGYYIYGKTKYLGNETHFVFSHENMKFAKEFIEKNLRKQDCFITIDECQAFTEMKSERTKILIDICKTLDCRDVLFMSGTPFKALGAEVIPYLWCADPTFDVYAEERFKKVFGIGGTRAIEILAARIGRSLYKIDKADVVKNISYNIELKVKLPNGDRYTLANIREKMKKFIIERVDYYKTHGPRFIEEYNRILDFYEKTLKDSGSSLRFSIYKKEAKLIRETPNLGKVKDEILRCNAFEKKEIIPKLPSGLKEKFRNASSVYKYVKLKIQGEALGRILGNERQECNLDILKNINNSKIYCEELGYDGEEWGLGDIFSMAQAKTIFFTDYIEVLLEAGDMFEKMGMKPALVYGDTNKDLNSILSKVEKDPEVDPIVATYKSLSTAVPLTMCSVAVFLNVPYRDYIYSQASSRLDRLGQKHVLEFYHVYLDTGTEPNISTRSKDIMQFSKEMVEALLGGELVDDGEIVEESFLENFLPTSLKEIKNLGWNSW